MPTPITQQEALGSDIARIVFREVLRGDRRKFAATSNDSPTGGGARDFRFRPYNRFGGIFSRLLPNRQTVTRVRGGVATAIEIYTSPATVFPGNHTVTMEFEPPTSARPNEGRLTRLSSYRLVVPADQRVILLIGQTKARHVFMAFATYEQVLANAWHPDVNKHLKKCFEQGRAINHAGQGYVDFELNTEFHK